MLLGNTRMLLAIGCLVWLEEKMMQQVILRLLMKKLWNIICSFLVFTP